MAVIETLNKPLKPATVMSFKSSKNRSEEIIDHMIKEFPMLIVDINEQRVSENILREEVEKLIDQSVFDTERQIIVREVMDYIFGYGPLQPYIDAPKISDIDGTRYDYFTIKEDGIRKKIDFEFSNEEEFLRFTKMIIIRNGGVINRFDSHCRVSDEKYYLRINGSIPPRNSTGPCLNIRKHSKYSFDYETLVERGLLTEETQKLFEKMNVEKNGVLICGKGGTGKTTLLRAILKDTSPTEQILVCESDCEIYPEKGHMIGQHVIMNRRGEHQIKLETLVKNGLTMSLDTYVIGEITGSEAYDLINAGHTGHRILTTIHANSAINAVDRLLLLMGHEKDLKESTKKFMICEALDYIVYLENYRVNEIIKVKGYDKKNESVDYKVLYSNDIQ